MKKEKRYSYGIYIYRVSFCYRRNSRNAQKKKTGANVAARREVTDSKQRPTVASGQHPRTHHHHHHPAAHRTPSLTKRGCGGGRCILLCRFSASLPALQHSKQTTLRTACWKIMKQRVYFEIQNRQSISWRMRYRTHVRQA